MATTKEEQKIPVQDINTTDKDSALSSFIEDPLLNAESFFEKNKKIISVALTVFTVAVVLYAGWKWYIQSQTEEAETASFQAVYYFEADSLNKALNGDGNNIGFLDIVDSYGLTPTGNLAKFYVGVIYLKQGKFEEAIESLKAFGSNDLLVQARAYSLIGDAYTELKQFEDAVSYYEKAANYKPNKEFTPTYLLKLALAQEKSNNLESALTTYNTILEDYPNTPASNDAKREQGRIESLLGK